MKDIDEKVLDKICDRAKRYIEIQLSRFGYNYEDLRENIYDRMTDRL